MGLGLQSHGRDQEHWVVLHDQEEGYQPPITSKLGVAKYLKVSV